MHTVSVNMCACGNTRYCSDSSTCIHYSFTVIAMNSWDRCKIIGLYEILHSLKQPCSNSDCH